MSRHQGFLGGSGGERGGSWYFPPPLWVMQ